METTTNTIDINTDKMNEMTARRVVEARARLAEAKAERRRGFGRFTVCLGLGFLARNNYKQCFCKI